MPHSLVSTDIGPADLQQAHTTRYAAMAKRLMLGAFVSVVCTMTLCLGLAGQGLLALAALAAGMGSGIVLMFMASASSANRRGKQMVYVPGSTGIDLAIQSVTDFLALYKRADRTAEDLNASARIMAARLADISYEPVTGIMRQGYHPNGDTYEQESLDFQWDLVQSAIKDLWPIYEGRKPATQNDVQALLVRMVPPLRNILHRVPIFIPELAYGGYDRQALVPPTRKELKAVRDMPAPPSPTSRGKTDGRRRTKGDTTTPVDVFTPVEQDLNAAALLLVATLRTQIAAFDGADPSLFAGTDQPSGRLLVDVHLPSLLRAYKTAHDASQGEERDDVRAQFARTLRTVGDSLDQIMVRHAAEARRVLDDEARFLESRNGPDNLGPA